LPSLFDTIVWAPGRASDLYNTASAISKDFFEDILFIGTTGMYREKADTIIEPGS